MKNTVLGNRVAHLECAGNPALRFRNVAGSPADAGADGMIYSFYGRLSVASTDTEKFASSDLPPTYFCYGTREPFVDEFEECVEALKEAGASTEVNVLEGRPHGYGYTEGWIPAYDAWLTEIFENNYVDTFR